MQVGTIDLNKLRGVADKGLGLGKEFVGTLLNNDRLQQEGEAQQERATAELKALKQELKAQKYEGKAAAFETKERAAQAAKDNGASLERKDKPGITEAIKGKAKEVVGDITDNAKLQREGEAQKEKGKADTDAANARAKAKAYEAEAKEKELEQRATQN